MITRPRRHAGCCRLAALLISSWVTFAAANGRTVGRAQGAEAATPLAPRTGAERELSGREVHTYRFGVEAGQFFMVVVDQRGIDLVATLSDPEGEQVAEVDSPNGSRGPEVVSFVAERAGDYRLQVRSLSADVPPGRYAIELTELRAATALDRSRVAAARAYARGILLRGGGTSDALRKAIEQFEEALKHYRSADDVPGEAATLNSIGSAYKSLNEPQQALGYFTRALPLLRLTGNRRAEAAALNNIGWVFDATGDPAQALDYYAQALPLRREAEDRRGEAITLADMGSVYRLLDDKRQALEHYSRALAIVHDLKDRTSEALALNNIGWIHSLSGEPRAALDYYTRALPLFREIGDGGGEATTLNNIGWAYRLLGDPAQATKHYERSLLLWRARDDREGEATTLYGMARVETDRGDFERARVFVEASIASEESAHSLIVSRSLRESRSASAQRYYALYIDVLMRLHERRPTAGYDRAALHVVERARARSLVEALSEAHADDARSENPILVTRRRELREKLNSESERLVRLGDEPGGAGNAQQRSLIERRIADLSAELLAIEAESKSRDARRRAKVAAVTADEIQHRLIDRGTLLLEYSLGENDSYLWAVTHDSLTSYRLPPRATIESAARRFHDLMSARARRLKFETDDELSERVRRTDGELAATATTLSRMLLAPVAHLMSGKRLLVVTDGALAYVPFAALPTPSAEESRSAHAQQSQPLIVGHEVISVPSASTLAALRAEAATTAPAASIAVFADPVFDASDERVASLSAAGSTAVTRPDERSTPAFLTAVPAPSAGAPNDSRTLSRLRYTRDEASAILALAAPKDRLAAFDFEANREAVVGRDLRRFRFVHFATHGLLNSTRPELSGVVLSLVSGEGRERDGFLPLHEIYDLKLDADMVVLSACRTGLGKEIRGEGLINLTRGFMHAGARRVLVSLWDVDDQATAEIMKRLYRRMLGPEKLTPAAALRAAQLDIRRETKWRSPYFWAGFVLEGDPR